ncbi:acyltransferase [Terrabacter sp. NPDC080008]|uniref:acyltransferase family protein n=1 Tax=Terrabacter sp. NPDC080008 TaxID=3155176 RepID=UPI003450001D
MKDRLSGRDNALNAIRLLLAVFVVVDHSFKAATGQPGPWPYLGGFAVDGFFAISGYLIAGSRIRTGMRPYLWSRGLRIMPGYWALLIFTALVVAPASALLDGRSYDWGSGGTYVMRNALLFTTQMGIDGTPTAVPYEGLWNASTWSLPYEAAAYVVFGLLVGLPNFRARSAAAVSSGLAACILVQVGAGVGLGTALELTRLWSFFAAGTLLWFLREWLPDTVAPAVVAGGIALGALLLGRGWYLAIAPVPLAFLLLWLGARLPLRIGSRNDISYGVYLFAFPLQQLMVVAGVPEALGLVWFTALSIAVTVPVAWASWLLVERPCLRWRRRAAVLARRQLAEEGIDLHAASRS